MITNEQVRHLEEVATELTAAAAAHFALANDLQRAKQKLEEGDYNMPVTSSSLRIHHVRTGLALLEGAHTLRLRAKRVQH